MINQFDISLCNEPNIKDIHSHFITYIEIIKNFKFLFKIHDIFYNSSFGLLKIYKLKCHNLDEFKLFMDIFYEIKSISIDTTKYQTECMLYDYTLNYFLENIPNDIIINYCREYINSKKYVNPCHIKFYYTIYETKPKLLRILNKIYKLKPTQFHIQIYNWIVNNLTEHLNKDLPKLDQIKRETGQYILNDHREISMPVSFEYINKNILGKQRFKNDILRIIDTITELSEKEYQTMINLLFGETCSIRNQRIFIYKHIKLHGNCYISEYQHQDRISFMLNKNKK